MILVLHSPPALIFSASTRIRVLPVSTVPGHGIGASRRITPKLNSDAVFFSVCCHMWPVGPRRSRGVSATLCPLPDCLLAASRAPAMHTMETNRNILSHAAAVAVTVAIAVVRTMLGRALLGPKASKLVCSGDAVSADGVWPGRRQKRGRKKNTLWHTPESRHDGAIMLRTLASVAACACCLKLRGWRRA